MKRKFCFVLMAVFLSIIFVSCSSSEGEVAVSGSTSMEKLVKALSEEYMSQYDVNIDVQLGGSSTGYTNVMSEISDIGDMSRDLKKDEINDDIEQRIIAYDGTAIIVNVENKVSNLSLEDIKNIYLGNITNWKELGGDDMEIVVVGREAGSGTREGFEEIAGVKDQCKLNAELNEGGMVAATVSFTKGAIGYISYGSLNDEVKAVKVNDVNISVKRIKDGSYVFRRPFIMVTKKDNTNQKAKEFLKYILSSEGQNIVKSKGYVPVL